MTADGELWDDTRDPQRLASVLRRSGLSAEQFARLMDEVAVAEAGEAERLGLPGLSKIRGGVRRQTVERWSRGTSTPKGWSARLALLVIERLERTLDSGFESDPHAAGAARVSWLRRVGASVRASWGAYLLAIVTLGVLAAGLGSLLAAGGSDDRPVSSTGASRTTALYPTGATPSVVPPVANDDPTRPRGAGCDPAPATPWWESPAVPLPDGIWFGRAIRVDGEPGSPRSMVVDIACFHVDDAGGVTIVPGGASLESERAVLVPLADDAVVHWLDGDGERVESDAATWLAASSDPSAGRPIPCPHGRCSIWLAAAGGIAHEIVVVDFDAE